VEDAQVLKLFGKRLQAARLAKGWSQEKLAFEADLDRTYVSSVERGRRNISIVNIYKLAKALDLAPHSLLMKIGGSDE
jgi:transcriptional regulator with XRE-family HTH domain